MASHTPDGEPIIMRAQLSERRWRWWRFCTCSAAFAQLYPILTPIYFCAGYSARKEEAESFSLTLTPHAIHYTQKLYACACCCQNTTTKTIPLDKVQDVMIVSDCCGDCCGYAEAGGAPYQLHVQTAGQGTPTPELSVFCLSNMTEFRAAVLAAKRQLTEAAGGGAAAADGGAGADKGTKNPAFGAAAGGNEMVVRVLERIEAALNEGLRDMRAGKA